MRDEMKDRLWKFDLPVVTEIPCFTLYEESEVEKFEKFLNDQGIPYKVEFESRYFVDDLKIYECMPENRYDFLKLVCSFDYYFYQ